jgi:Sporulation and spore germination
MPPSRPVIFVMALLSAMTWPGCDGPSKTAPDAPPFAVDGTTAVEGSAGGDEGAAVVPDAPMRRLNVLVYYPAVDGDGLVGESHEIFMTPTPGDRAKQILADLIAGPIGESGLRSIPAGTRLRQVYVLENGTAYVDFSADLKQGLAGGSAKELFAVYSIVNSLALNIPEIRRVGILIDGEPVDTLNGHMDLSRPLSPDSSMIVGSREPIVADASRGDRGHAG